MEANIYLVIAAFALAIIAGVLIFRSWRQ